MPVGIIVDCASVLIGGLIGNFVKEYLSDSFKENLNLIFGLCSITMAISSIILMKTMPAVILSVVIGTSLGLVFHIQDKEKVAIFYQSVSNKKYKTMIYLLRVLYCFVQAEQVSMDHLY
ncbi:DUF554 family protein [Floccifex sp.]|uniref:DUF554 family protein n=1 Tax=Floccifex sp. TaxID=2815810 RepID=UPI002A76083A|nr:DUF554 family protein [Floccifex sp.]MDD7282059.1 DUF554 family protein [Erysipelotrichaceae bacterium]MDY2958756.1 DUF554 family protein [Floccifex sp.]